MKARQGSFYDKLPVDVSRQFPEPSNWRQASPDQVRDLDTLQRDAKKGDAEAQYQFGIWYQTRTPPDYAGAAEWYRKAAEQGHSSASKKLELLESQGLVQKR